VAVRGVCLLPFLAAFRRWSSGCSSRWTRFYEKTTPIAVEHAPSRLKGRDSLYRTFVAADYNRAITAGAYLLLRAFAYVSKSSRLLMF
jgi:hypothetical protein